MHKKSQRLHFLVPSSRYPGSLFPRCCRWKTYLWAIRVPCRTACRLAATSIQIPWLSAWQSSPRCTCFPSSRVVEHVGAPPPGALLKARPHGPCADLRCSAVQLALRARRPPALLLLLSAAARRCAAPTNAPTAPVDTPGRLPDVLPSSTDNVASPLSTDGGSTVNRQPQPPAPAMKITGLVIASSLARFLSTVGRELERGAGGSRVKRFHGSTVPRFHSLTIPRFHGPTMVVGQAEGISCCCRPVIHPRE